MDTMTDLHNAIALNDQKSVIKLLKQIIDVDIVIDKESGTTVLHWAVTNRHYDLVKKLIKKKVNINSRLRNLKTALHLAAETIDIKMLDILLNDCNLLIYAKDNKKSTALHLIIQVYINKYLNKKNEILYENEEYYYNDNCYIICRVISLSDSASIDAQDNNGNTPLHILASAPVDDSLLHFAKAMIKKSENLNIQNKKLETALYISVKNRNIDLTSNLLSKGAKFDEPFFHKKSPLMAAIENYHVLMIILLINNCVTIDTKYLSKKHLLKKLPKKYYSSTELTDFLKDYSSTELTDFLIELIFCSDKSYLSEFIPLYSINLLLDSSSRVRLISSFRCTFLHIAVIMNNYELAQTLINKGINIDFQDQIGNTALMLAVASGNLAMVDLLVSSNANVDLQNDYGYTPLHQATEDNDYECLRLLLIKKANPNIKNHKNHLPIVAAVEYDNLESINLLLLKGSDPNVQIIDGTTLLVWAIQKRYLYIIDLLLKAGADLDTYLYEDGSTIIQKMIIGHERYKSGTWAEVASDIVNLMLENCKDFNVQNRKGETILMTAVQHSVHSTVELLLQQKSVDVDIADENGNTALMIAIEHESYDSTKLLIKNNAKLNVQNNNGDTALTLLIVKCCQTKIFNDKIVNRILSRGSLPNQKNNSGQSAITLAASQNNFKMVELLLKYNDSIDLGFVGGHTILSWAIKCGQIRIVESLLQQGVDCNQKNQLNQTPLCIAVLNKQAEIVVKLLCYGADPNAVVSISGDTVLHVATNGKIFNIILYLILSGGCLKYQNSFGEIPGDNLANNQYFSTECKEFLKIVDQKCNNKCTSADHVVKDLIDNIYQPLSLTELAIDSIKKTLFVDDDYCQIEKVLCKIVNFHSTIYNYKINEKAQSLYFLVMYNLCSKLNDCYPTKSFIDSILTSQCFEKRKEAVILLSILYGVAFGNAECDFLLEIRKFQADHNITISEQTEILLNLCSSLPKESPDSKLNHMIIERIDSLNCLRP